MFTETFVSDIGSFFSFNEGDGAVYSNAASKFKNTTFTNNIGGAFKAELAPNTNAVFLNCNWRLNSGKNGSAISIALREVGTGASVQVSGGIFDSNEGI